MMLRKIPDDPGYSQQELALLRGCLLDLLRVQDGRFGVCGTLEDMLIEACGFNRSVDGYEFCRYAAYSWEHTLFDEAGDPKSYFIDGDAKSYFIDGDAASKWEGRGLELRIDFMKHCLGVVAKLESELPK